MEATARFCGACGAALEDSNVGRVIGGRYTLKERIGQGSIGVVYAAEQVGLGRKLAIKLLPASAAHDPTLIERFRREGEVLCRLQSGHTVTTYEFDRDADGTFYIAMERPTGTSLAEAFQRDGAFAWPRVLRILAGLCDSLGEAHALGVIHRNLKLENILIEPRVGNPDFVKVLDFGLAKLLPSRIDLSPVGETVGAIEFISPEQLMSRPIDGRSDLYALGMLGYLLVTGQHPFARARTYGDLIAAHVQLVPAPASSLRPELPHEVDMMFARLLEKDPARRFPDATSLAQLISEMLAPLGFAGLPGEPEPPEPEPPNGDEDTAVAPAPAKPPR